MAIAFQALIYRTPRRIRLRFSNTLAAGAFVTSWFTVTSLDDIGASPQVTEAIRVPSQGDEVELALGIDLAPDGAYRVEIAAGVPATDLTTAPSATTDFRAPVAPGSPSISVTIDDNTALVFGEDVVWNGKDFVETSEYDLATVTGPENAKAATLRRALADGLPHDATYGARARASVDGLDRAGLRTRLERNLKLDDRLEDVRVDLIEDENDGDVAYQAELIFIGGTSDSLKITGT